jgi:hypothetical protein
MPSMTTDEIQQMLLARLGGEDSEAPLPLDLIEQAVGDDPVAGKVLAALRRRQATQATQAAHTAAVAEADFPVPTAGTALNDAAVADVLSRLYAEVEALREVNEVLADALGACSRCWGADARCLRCRGRGRPGGRAPDSVLFAEYVQPALRRQYRQSSPSQAQELPTPR